MWNPATLGYEVTEDPAIDTFMVARLGPMREAALNYRRALLAAWLFAPNSAARHMAVRTRRRYRVVFGSTTLLEQFQSLIMCLFAAVEAGRIWWRRRRGHGDIVRQPVLRRTEFSGVARVARHHPSGAAVGNGSAELRARSSTGSPV